MDIFNVLMVDDEKDFLNTLTKRLVKRGLDITCANSGEEALSVVKGKKIDVVVLDVRMPGIDGIQTLKDIKKINPSIEVILLTGHANIDVAMEGMKIGAFDYLMKPIDIDELLYRIQDAYTSKSILEKKNSISHDAAEKA
jgi:DNA-binding NtrC family response regulator